MLKNIVLFTNNIEELSTFYQEVFGLLPMATREGNVVLTGGLVLQDADVFAPDGFSQSATNTMLYFEERDLDYICKKLETYGITPLPGEAPNPAGKMCIRFADPEGHLIEVAKED